MKKLFLLAAAALLSASVSLSAQNEEKDQNQKEINAGQFVLGAFGGANIEKGYYNLSFSPYGEYLAADRFGVGVQLSYSVMNNISDDCGNGVDHQFGFGAFASYYVAIVPNFYFKPMFEVNLMFDGGPHFEAALVPAFQYSAWQRLSFLIKAGGLSYGDFRLDGYRVRLNIANQVALGLAYSF